jgi:SAM-dependent MidA family methyltransferase
VGALHFLDRLAQFLGSGYALLIDYPASDASGPVHGYRRHRVVEDVIGSPGSTDITSGVDMDAVARRAELLGLRSHLPVTQRSALLSLGLAEWLEEERRQQAAFQDARAGREAVLAWSGRSQASLLVDPQGLGRIRWLVLATAGLQWPQWLADAALRDRGQGLSRVHS